MHLQQNLLPMALATRPLGELRHRPRRTPVLAASVQLLQQAGQWSRQQYPRPMSVARKGRCRHRRQHSNHLRASAWGVSRPALCLPMGSRSPMQQVALPLRGQGHGQRQASLCRHRPSLRQAVLVLRVVLPRRGVPMEPPRSQWTAWRTS